MKVAQNEKRKKNYMGFSYYKNIASFKVFWQDKNFSKNILFLGSDVIYILVIFIVEVELIFLYLKKKQFQALEPILQENSPMCQ